MLRSRIVRRIAARAVAAGLLGAAMAAAAGENASGGLEVSFHRETRRLEISAPAHAGEAIELRIETPGVTRLETGSDVNEPGEIYLPPPTADALPEPAENIFFFNELTDAPEWELVLRFGDKANGRWKLNGRFSPLGGAQAAEVVLPVDALEHGENLLHLTGESRRAPEFFYRRRFPAGEAASCSIGVEPFNWSGRVQRWRVENGREESIAQKDVSSEALPRESILWPVAWWRDRERLVETARSVGENLCRNQVRRPGSRFEGGFNLVYDASRTSHRIPHWVWSWGPAIDLLLQLSKLDAAQTANRAAAFRDVAVAAGKRSLQFGITDPRHVAHGVSTVRWEPSRATPLGWVEYASPTDSLFLAGWGWMALYEHTREPVYLERTRDLVTAAERLHQRYGVIPQDWIFERERWTPHTLDESLFGTIGFRRLHEATGDPLVQENGRKFIDSFLVAMGRADGLLARGWMREEHRDIWDPDIKGHAWVIEGYLDAYRMTGDAKYLSLARQLAARVISCQGPGGGWTFQFRMPRAEDAIDDKGTAIWAFLFYQLHRVTHDPAHLTAARRALGWCLAHQYRGADLNLDGAILHVNNMAHVRSRPITVLYTTTFFGLAILEELALAP